MLKSILKWSLFPLLGLALAFSHIQYVGKNFVPEETIFELPQIQSGASPSIAGATATTLAGKRIWAIQEQALFPFSISQPNSLFVPLKYQAKGDSSGRQVRFFINNVLLADLLLPSTPAPFDQVSLRIPFHLLRPGENTLEIRKSREDHYPLYIESLKIRNFMGYSTGLLTAYILPRPINPALSLEIQWDAHKRIIGCFMAFYALLGLVYGFLLSHRLRIPLALSLGKGFLSLLPSLFLVFIMALTSRIISGHLLLELKSFVILHSVLTLIVMAVQLRLTQPLFTFLYMFSQKLFRKREWVILLLVAGLLLSVLYLYSLKFDKNITGFMVIGDYFEAPQVWTPQTLIHRGSVGYDGQFYYYIAHDPFITSHSYGHIDFPAYRYQRIIYPLAAWLLSLGQPKLIPYMMLVLNLLSIVLGTWGSILILKHFRRNPWYSLCYASFWGLLLCLLRCLPEPLAMAFVVWSSYFYLKERPEWQVFYLALAALTQETTLLIPMAFLFYYLWKKDFRRSFFMFFPPLAYLVWQLYIFSRFRAFSFLGGTQNFGIPFWGLLQKIHLLTQGNISFDSTAQMLYLIGIFALIIIAFSQVLEKRNPFTLAFAGYALMTALLNQLIWVEPWSYARATLGLLFFNLLIFTKEGRWLNLWPMLLGPFIFSLSLIAMKLL